MKLTLKWNLYCTCIRRKYFAKGRGYLDASNDFCCHFMIVEENCWLLLACEGQTNLFRFSSQNRESRQIFTIFQLTNIFNSISRHHIQPKKLCKPQQAKTMQELPQLPETKSYYAKWSLPDAQSINGDPQTETTQTISQLLTNDKRYIHMADFS